MPILQPSEIQAGLNVFLDPAVLLERGDATTNAGEGNHVNRTGPFLVLEVNQNEQRCLCVPLFSHRNDDRIELDQSLKSGPGRGWIERPSYYQPLQFWMIPFETLVAASHGEINKVGNRQQYATHAPDALVEIANHKNDSSFAFLPPS